LTDSLIKDCIKQEALTRAAIKKKYCKWAKNYRNKKIAEECYKKSVSSSSEFN
jgi:hypothetical protein